MTQKYFFLCCPRHCDQGLIVIIIYDFQIWTKKELAGCPRGVIAKISFFMHCYREIGLEFANIPGDLGSISGRAIPKTLKMVLDTSLLNTQQYKVRIEGKVKQSRGRSSTAPTLQCSSYWKGSLLVVLEYGRQLYRKIIFPCITMGK